MSRYREMLVRDVDQGIHAVGIERERAVPRLDVAHGADQRVAVFENFAREIVEADVDIDRAAADGLRAVQRGRPDIRREADRPPGRHGQGLFDRGRERGRGHIRRQGGSRSSEPEPKQRETRTKPLCAPRCASLPPIRGPCPPRGRVGPDPLRHRPCGEARRQDQAGHKRSRKGFAAYSADGCCFANTPGVQCAVTGVAQYCTRIFGWTQIRRPDCRFA